MTPPPINGSSGKWPGWLIAAVSTVLIGVGFLVGSTLATHGREIAEIKEQVKALERDFYSRPR